MYADEKSDEAVVPRKRPNKGRQLPAEVVEGRASPEGNSRQAARGSDSAPSCHVDPIGGCAPDCMRFQNREPPTFDPREVSRCVSSARRDLCGGRGVILVPTATKCVESREAKLFLLGERCPPSSLLWQTSHPQALRKPCQISRPVPRDPVFDVGDAHRRISIA